MIVRDKPTVWQLFFVLRGSIIPRIGWKVASVVALSVGVVALQDVGMLHTAPIAALPFSLIGIAISIFAGFRNSACYDRWWEGRKIWGQMLVDTRSLVRQAQAYPVPPQPAGARRLALQCIAFAAALRDYLRGVASTDAVAPTRPAARNPPNLILGRLSAEIAGLLSKGHLAAPTAQMLEERVVALSGALAASERIKSAPVPYAYSLLLHRTAYLFCLLLPFGLTAATGAWTPVAVGLVSYTFFGLDALGDELEAPFGTGVNALPLDAIVRTIEISLLEMLGDTDLPSDPAPVDYVLR